MTSETRLGEIVTALESVGISSLVMGGHAVRFYGLSRNTNDFELHVAPGSWDTLALRLGRCSLFAGPDLPEGPSWRAHAFRRFRIGTLPDGADEWLRPSSSPLHLSLVEVVRRRYIQFRKDADRRDKEAILARLGPRDR